MTTDEEVDGTIVENDVETLRLFSMTYQRRNRTQLRGTLQRRQFIRMGPYARSTNSDATVR